MSRYEHPMNPHLGILDITITGPFSNQQFDPNGLIVAAFENRVMDGPFKTMFSPLSGKPAMIYRTHGVTIPLTKGEIERLARRSLKPSEYLVLRAIYGIFHEIHDDFYDDQGNALQPK